MNKRRLKHFEKLLQVYREQELQLLSQIEAELDESVANASGDLSTHPSHDLADSGTDTAGREKNFYLASMEGDTLVEIDEALRKIYAGTYGVCEMCGCAIPEERLEAVPFARLCLECKKREEELR
jgi:DnaK suppressor protein